MAEGTWRDARWAPSQPFQWVDWLLIGADPARWGEQDSKGRRALARQTDRLASYLTDDPAANQWPSKRGLLPDRGRDGYLGDAGQIENPDARGYLSSVLRMLSPESAEEATAAIPEAVARRRWFQGWYVGGLHPDTAPAHLALRERDRILNATGDSELAELVRAAAFDGCDRARMTGTSRRMVGIPLTDRDREVARVLAGQRLARVKPVRGVSTDRMDRLHSMADMVAVMMADLPEAVAGQPEATLVTTEEAARRAARRVDKAITGGQALGDEPNATAFLADPRLIARGQPSTYADLATMNGLARVLPDQPDPAIGRLETFRNRFSLRWDLIKGRQPPSPEEHGIEGH